MAAISDPIQELVLGFFIILQIHSSAKWGSFSAGTGLHLGTLDETAVFVTANHNTLGPNPHVHHFIFIAAPSNVSLLSRRVTNLLHINDLFWQEIVFFVVLRNQLL